MLHGRIWTKVLRYALPVAATGILEQLFNASGIMIVGNFSQGGGTATVIANIASSMILLYRLVHTDAAIHVNLRELGIDPLTLRQIMRIGLPAGVQSAVFAVANIIIQAAINSLGTVVMAASSAAFNIEIIAYYVLNSFSQACATFTGQNYGARQIGRCKRVLGICILEDFIATASTIAVVLLFGHRLLALFDATPEVIAVGYTRLVMVFSAYTFSMLYEVMSGYLRGFGISLVPALLTVIGVVGVRITWIAFVFPAHRTFEAIMIVYPISLAATAVLIGIALLCYRPSKRFAVKP